MLNRVVYCGRIATELNVRKSKNNKSFNNKAENLVKYQSKGNLIIIEGSTETYKKDNINMSRCLVDRITYLENKKEDSIQSVIDSEEDKNENYDIISGEDLPF